MSRQPADRLLGHIVEAHPFEQLVGEVPQGQQRWHRRREEP